MNHRRAFLQFLATSPLLAGGIAREALAQAVATDSLDPLSVPVIQASDALDIFDLERVARQNIPPTHWGSLIAGVDGEDTLRANRDAYSHWQLRARRLVDLSKLDMSVTLFGTRYASPIYLSAIGAQKAFHPDGEVGSARAAKAHNQLQMLSSVPSCTLESVVEARGAPVWCQLYTSSTFEVIMTLVRRAEAAGCTAAAVTVDLPIGRNTPTITRWMRTDHRNCIACHAVGGPQLENLPNFKGLDMMPPAGRTPTLTWDLIRRIKDGTRMKIAVKGLESAEDAALAVQHGMDAVVVSNHGGRSTETGRGTLDDLPEVTKAVGGRIPVFLDGGVRRGTDVLKALALGATAVGIGRAYVFGLGAFGEAGVDRALAILNEEFRLSMAGVGARSVKEITSATLVRNSL